MKVSYTDKLSTKLFAPVVIIFTLVIATLLTYVPSVINQNAVDPAIASAVSTVNQYKTIRGYYTKNVVKKVLDGSDMKAHYQHEGDAGKIPLPATFIHDLSKTFSEKGIMTIKLYSPYPFPNRNERQLDDFGKAAWDSLSKNPQENFTRETDINGRRMVRVAVADTMSQQGCVDCHNSHPETPKDDWQLNDVRGVLEVQVPIDDQIAAATRLNATVTGLVLLALSATVALLFAMFRKLISSRLREVRQALQEIADGDGDLSQRLQEKPLDEIGAIAVAFNNFMAQMELAIKTISGQVRELANTTQTMESTSQQTKQSSNRQKMETDQVASAMNEMMATAQEMANLANTTAEKSQDTSDKSEQGRTIVAENRRAVEELSATMGKVSEVVSNLEVDSQNIGGVLDVIRGIAEQTNLLALNAAIEAARAGEQGRGFAVVADEVRTLASRTQESTEEIQRMIAQLQEGAQGAVKTISVGNRSIEASLEKAEETNDTIGEIDDAVTGIQNLNLQVATAAEQQTSVCEEINRNIINIAQESIASTENSEQMLTLSGDINRAAQAINDQLHRFIK